MFGPLKCTRNSTECIRNVPNSMEFNRIYRMICFSCLADVMCQLRKSINGLKQASRIWNLQICHFLKSICFEQLYSDPCVYINKTTGIIIAIWVDDLIIFGKDMPSINALKVQLNEEYEMKDLSELKYFLSIQVHRNQGRQSVGSIRFPNTGPTEISRSR